MKIIGLCGRSGSGKGYVSGVFAKYGGICLDTDKIYHRLLEPIDSEMSECTQALAGRFGSEIVGSDMQLDRKRLSEIVFSDKEKLEELNKIAHSYILREVEKQLSVSKADFAVIDAPVLFESGFDKICDFTVCTVCSDNTSVKRITERDGIEPDKAVLRLKNQLSADTLTDLCDYTVYNDGDSDVFIQVKNILTDMGLYHEL